MNSLTPSRDSASHDLLRNRFNVYPKDHNKLWAPLSEHNMMRFHNGQSRAKGSNADVIQIPAHATGICQT